MLCDICVRRKKDKVPCPEGCPGAPKLNAGSGAMLKPDFINYDALGTWSRGGLTTDIVGSIEEMREVLWQGIFSEILCVHVIEHFRAQAANAMLRDFFTLLRRGGRLVLEGPDLLGVYWYYVEQKQDIPAYIDMLFSERNRLKYGEPMAHRSGWTRGIAAQAVLDAGFTLTHTGIGLTHGMGKRDFRVEGIKG